MPRLETPVLFLIFNRPEETARVFAAIRAQRPKNLFIAADGPRQDRTNEAALVAQTRAIVAEVDWPCDVETLYRESNLGCGAAVSSAISWFFDHNEEGIILEDDCLPHPDFFGYCATLLQRYRNETAVATIGGTHFLPPALPHQRTHYASKYFQMWGWASWRRIWQHYDFDLNGQSEADWIKLLRERHPIAVEWGYWREIYRALKRGTIDTWDFQVFFSCWSLGSCHIAPGRNLVSNIGHGPSATHTNFASNMAHLPTFPLTVGTEDISLTPDATIDNIIFYLRFLESMTHTWWVDQVLCPEQKLGEVRTALALKERRVRELELEVSLKRRQLLAATRALAASGAMAPCV